MKKNGNTWNRSFFGHIVFLCLIARFGAAETPFLADWAAADAEVAAVYADMAENAPVYMPCPFRYKQALGLIPFDPDGFPDLTNRAPSHLVLDWPVYGLTVTETQQISRVWLYSDDNRDAVHTNAVPSGFDPQAWVRSAYGTPPSWITGTNLTRWYSDRDRSRVLLRIDLVPSNTYEALSEALIAARTNAIPQPTGPVMPANSNRLSFAGIEAAGENGAPGLWIYTPVDGLAVDLFSRGSLTDGQRWTHRGVLNAAAPFAPWDPGTNTMCMEFYAAARADIDSDSDGIPDGREMLANGTNPNAGDTDADGLGDFTEIFRYGTSALLVDTDGDGLTDYEEVLLGADPLTDDMDDDGLTDMTEVYETFTPFNDRDADNDGLSDYQEVVLYHTSPFNPDTEFDGIDDYDEIGLGTSPLLSDTDGDGICDYTELYYDQYLSPTNAADAAGDIDNDGFSNLIEYQNFWSLTSPTNGYESARFLMICVNPGSNSIIFKTGGLTGTYSFFALGDAGDASSILRIPPTKEVGGTMVKRLYHSGSPHVRLDGTPLSELGSPILVPDTSGTVDYRVTALPSSQGNMADFWLGNDQGVTNTAKLTCRLPKVTTNEFRDRNGTRHVDVAYGATGTLVLAWSPDPRNPAGVHVTPTISPSYVSGIPLLDRRDYPLARVTGAVTNYTASLNYYRYDSAYRFRRGLILPVGKHLVAVGLDWNLDGQLQDDEVSMACEVYVLKVEFLDNESTPINPTSGKLLISNFPTDQRLSLTNGSADPDNFRVRITPNIAGASNPTVQLKSYCINDLLLDSLEVTLTETNNAYYSEYLRLVIPDDATNIPAQTIKAELLGNVRIVSTSLNADVGATISVASTDYVKIIDLHVTIFSQGGVFLFGESATGAIAMVQNNLDAANLIYASAGVQFRANIKTHDIPHGGGITLSNGIPCGIVIGPNVFTDMAIGSNGKWQVPHELQLFKNYISNATNNVLSANATDIEVLYVLPDTGFSYIDGFDEYGQEGPEKTHQGTIGIADTPDLPSTTNVYHDTAVGTHSIYLRSRVSGHLEEDRKLLAHEILHIATREYHSDGGADDDVFWDHNLFLYGRRITTAKYLLCYGYSVSSSLYNQEEKVRTSPLLRTQEEE